MRPKKIINNAFEVCSLISKYQKEYQKF
ncbi:hypothetical protein NC653_016565 [Populus alba x Populus x berolinensis]|uniref:Uncharacterized protein n=1 Tax=Populus alba x Populus x berolinensis TaxID=444605 RepID=A0AAD6VZW6_9ROSI|nr:hypothetical protein NC653_016565 [Populus alba x Populus x berolinensis]